MGEIDGTQRGGGGKMANAARGAEPAGASRSGAAGDKGGGSSNSGGSKAAAERQV